MAPWRALAQLHDRALAARSLSELCFIAVNETWQLMPHRQAVLWRINSRDRPRLRTVSGLAQLAEDSPNTVWLRRLGRHLHRRDPTGRAGPVFVAAGDLQAQYGTVTVGPVPQVREQCYAVSNGRKIEHPAVEAIIAAANRGVFNPQ